MTQYSSHPSTITVPATPQSLDDLDLEFAEGEQARKPVTEVPRLWWHNGLPVVDTETVATGWHIKAGIDPAIDETMEGMGVPRYLVQHKRPGKDGDNSPKPYWRLRSCSLIVIASRVQSTLELSRSTDERFGIAFGWGTARDDDGNAELKEDGEPRKGTSLRMRVYVHEMVRHGYCECLPISLNGFSTDYMLTALQEQYRVLDAYAAYRKAQGRSGVAPFYLFSLPTAPGPMKIVGKAPKQGTIYPILAQPPATIDRAYLEQHLISKDLAELIRAGILEETVSWSITESQRITMGKGDENGQPAAIAQHSEQDAVVTQPQIAWIIQQYCKGNAGVIRATCERFGVKEVNQLRGSHFRTLVGEQQGS